LARKSKEKATKVVEKLIPLATQADHVRVLKLLVASDLKYFCPEPRLTPQRCRRVDARVERYERIPKTAISQINEDGKHPKFGRKRHGVDQEIQNTGCSHFEEEAVRHF
jgi:hypothetical protein